MRNKKYWKRAAAWILTAAMVLSSNSFAALAEDGTVVAESAEAVTEAPEAAAQETQDVSADVLGGGQSEEDQEAPAADTEVTVADTEAPAAETEAIAALTDAAEEPAAEDTDAPTEVIEAADAEAPETDEKVSAEDTEVSAEDEELITVDEIVQVDEFDQLFAAEAAADAEEEHKIVKVELLDDISEISFQDLPDALEKIRVQVTFDDGTTDFINEFSQEYMDDYIILSRYAYYEGDWTGQNICVALFRDGKPRSIPNISFAVERTEMLGEFELEIYVEGNESVNVKKPISITLPETIPEITEEKYIDLSLQPGEAVMYQFRAAHTAEYTLPFVLSSGKVNGCIYTYDESDNALITKAYNFDGSKNTLNAVQNQKYLILLMNPRYYDAVVEGQFCVMKRQNPVGFAFQQDSMRLTPNALQQMMGVNEFKFPAEISYTNDTELVTTWHGMTGGVSAMSQQGDMLFAEIQDAGGETVPYEEYSTLEPGTYTVNGYITNGSENLFSDTMELQIVESAAGSITEFIYSGDYEGAEFLGWLYTDSTLNLNVQTEGLDMNRTYTVEWSVVSRMSTSSEKSLYAKWKTEEDGSLSLSAFKPEGYQKGDEDLDPSVYITAELVCDGEIVDQKNCSLMLKVPYCEVREYPEPESTVKLLRGESASINIWAYQYDVEHSGDEIWPKVTDVSLVGEDTGAVSVQSGTDEEMGVVWRVTGQKAGTATVKVTYETPGGNGETTSFIFYVNVVEEEYVLDDFYPEKPLLTNEEKIFDTHLFMRTSNDLYGEETEVTDYSVQVTRISAEEGKPKTTAVAEGTKIKVNTGATEEWICVYYDALVDGEVVASSSIEFSVKEEYYKVVTVNSNEDPTDDYILYPGETLDWEKLGVKVYRCTSGSEQDVTSNPEIKLEVLTYDYGWIELGETGENGFPMLKRGAYGEMCLYFECREQISDEESIWLCTDYTTFGYMEEYGNLNLIPSYDGATVFSDQPMTLTLDTSMFSDLENCNISWTVEAYMNGEGWSDVEEGAGLWEASGTEITLYAPEEYYGSTVTVYASVNYDTGEENYVLGYAATDLDVRESRFEPEIYLEGEMVPGAEFYCQNTVEVYVKDSKHPFGEHAYAEVQDIVLSEPSLMEKTLTDEGIWLKAVKTGELTVTFTLKCEELWGSDTCNYEKTVEILPYYYNLYAWMKGNGTEDSLYMEDTAQIQCSLVLTEEKDGQAETNEVPKDQYTLTYSTDDTDIISVSEDGVITSKTENDYAYVRVNAWVGGETVASEVVEVYVKSDAREIRLSDNYYITLAPGETRVLQPVVMDFNKEYPDGNPVPGDWTYSIVELNDYLTEGSEPLSVTAADVTRYTDTYILIAADSKTEGHYENWAEIDIDPDAEAHTHHYDDGKVTKAPTCTEKGVKTFTCSCGAKKTEEIPALGHAWDNGTVTTAATCAKAGVKTFKCKNGCGETKTETIPKLTTHSYGKGVTVSEATVFAKEKQKKTCSVCGATQTVEVGSTLKPVLKVTATSLKMKQKQSTTKFKVTEMAAGDSLKSVVSSNTKIVKVSSVKAGGTFKLTAQKKKGSAKITITLKSGMTKTVTVKVQSAKVTTSKISGVPKKATLKVKKKLTLKPVLAPVTSQDKITYTSSNKKVATVSSRGVVTAKKAGTVKITVKAGKKKVTCTVKVTK